MKKLALVSAAVALLSLGAVACTSTSGPLSGGRADYAGNSVREDANLARAERAQSESNGGEATSGTSSNAAGRGPAH